MPTFVPCRRTCRAAILAALMVVLPAVGCSSGPAQPTSRSDYSQGQQERQNYKRATDTSPYRSAR